MGTSLSLWPFIALPSPRPPKKKGGGSTTPGFFTRGRPPLAPPRAGLRKPPCVLDANSKIEHATSDVRFGEPSTVFRWLRVKCPGVDTVRAEVSHSTGDGVSNTNFDDTLQQRRRAILLDQYDGKDVVLYWQRPRGSGASRSGMAASTSCRPSSHNHRLSIAMFVL